MNEFLEKLESKLDAIDEKERKKIIKKYQRIIEEKMKDKMTEKEAVKSLGNIDDIAKEICENYHVNLVNRKRNFNEYLNDGIEESAKFLSETFKDVVNYSKAATKDNFLVSFFEVLLKVVILIMVFMLLKIPFLLIQIGVDFVIDFLFYPFNVVLGNIFDYIIAILYGGCCIGASVYMFKGYYISHEKGSDESLELKEEEDKKQSKNNVNYALMIVKALIVFIVVIPLILLNLTLLGLTAFAIFLVFKGVPIIGLSILLLSFFLLTLLLTVYVTDVLDKKERNHIFVLCISLVSLIIGGVLFVDDLMNYNYPTELTDSNLEALTESLTIDLDKKTVFTFLDGDVEYIIDNSIVDNKVLVEVTYYDNFVDIALKKYLGEDLNQIIIYSEYDEATFETYMYLYDNMIEDLKDNNVFNYTKVNKYKVNIYCNEKTKELVK